MKVFSWKLWDLHFQSINVEGLHSHPKLNPMKNDRSKNYQLSSQQVTPGWRAMWQTSLALNKCASHFSHNSLAFKERTVSTVWCCSMWHFHKVNTLVFLFTPKPWSWGSTELFGIKSNCLVFCNLMGLYNEWIRKVQNQAAWWRRNSVKFLGKWLHDVSAECLTF